MRVELQPAFIMHRRAYRNTSWLLDVFTREYGLIALVAKGARRAGHAWRYLLEPFNSLLLGFSGRSDLMTLIAAERGDFRPRFSGNTIYAGMYINELLLRMLHHNDPHETLFSAYLQALQELALPDGNIEPALRRFEISLLREVGYGLQLDHLIEAEKTYCYDIENGPLVADPSRHGDKPAVSGYCLLSLAKNNYSDQRLYPEMKRLLRYIINYHLAGKPLRSRELFTASRPE